MGALKPSLAILGVICLGAALTVPRTPPSTEHGSSGDPKVGTHPGGIGLSSSSGVAADLRPAQGHGLAAFSGGCFWGVEDEFRHTPGVVATAVGYTGGHLSNPTYEQVCTHTTGHAETVLLEFDPKKVSYKELLEKFWTIHDPTTVDRQGPDEGNNYRSAIWTYSDEQLKQAMASRNARQAKESSKIVTEIQPAPTFYMAEDYHQQYDEKTGRRWCPAPRGGG